MGYKIYDIEKYTIKDFCNDEWHLKRVSLVLFLSNLGNHMLKSKNEECYFINSIEKKTILKISKHILDRPLDDIKILEFEETGKKYTLVEVEKLNEVINRAYDIEGNYLKQTKEDYFDFKILKVKNILQDKDKEIDINYINNMYIPTLISQYIIIYILDTDGKRDFIGNIFNTSYYKVLYQDKEKWINHKINEFYFITNNLLYLCNVDNLIKLNMLIDNIKKDLTQLKDEFHLCDMVALTYMVSNKKNINDMIEIILIYKNLYSKNIVCEESEKTHEIQDNYNKYYEKTRKVVYKVFKSLGIKHLKLNKNNNAIRIKKRQLPFLCACIIFVAQNSNIKKSKQDERAAYLKDIFSRTNESVTFSYILKITFDKFFDSFGRELKNIKDIKNIKSIKNIKPMKCIKKVKIVKYKNKIQVMESIESIFNHTTSFWSIESLIFVLDNNIDINHEIFCEYKKLKKAIITKLNKRLDKNYFEYLISYKVYNQELELKKVKLLSKKFKEKVENKICQVDKIHKETDNVIRYYSAK